MDAEGVDILDVGIFLPQCKRGRDYANPNKIKEVRSDDGIPLLFTKGDRKKSMVCMYEEHFWYLLSFYDLKNRGKKD